MMHQCHALGIRSRRNLGNVLRMSLQLLQPPPMSSREHVPLVYAMEWPSPLASSHPSFIPLLPPNHLFFFFSHSQFFKMLKVIDCFVLLKIKIKYLVWQQNILFKWKGRRLRVVADDGSGLFLPRFPSALCSRPSAFSPAVTHAGLPRPLRPLGLGACQSIIQNASQALTHPPCLLANFLTF